VALEEPESHLFPYLVNTMAEDLARAVQDGTYVILSTHNPYLLVALLEKAPKDKLALYYVYMDDEKRKTRFARVRDDLIGEILDYEYASPFTIEDILRDSGYKMKPRGALVLYERDNDRLIATTVKELLIRDCSLSRLSLEGHPS
jgi:signal recognition particle subunit SEC65